MAGRLAQVSPRFPRWRSGRRAISTGRERRRGWPATVPLFRGRETPRCHRQTARQGLRRRARCAL